MILLWEYFYYANGHNDGFRLELSVDSTLECIVPIWWYGYWQGFTSESVTDEGILEVNNQVWWFQTQIFTFIWSDSSGLFPVRISQTAGVRDPFANISAHLTTYCGFLCRYVTYYAATCAMWIKDRCPDVHCNRRREVCTLQIKVYFNI